MSEGHEVNRLEKPDGEAQGSDPREAAGAGGGRLATYLYVVAVLGVLGLFLFSVQAILSPFTLFLLFLFMVWPFVGTRAHVRLVGAASILFLLWVFETTGLLLAPFILSMILAYVLDPVIDVLEARRVPRTAAIALLAVPVAGIGVLIVLVLLPAVGHQVATLASELPGYASALRDWLAGVRDWVIGLGIPGVTQDTVPRVRDFDAGTLVRYVEERRSAFLQGGLRAALGVGRGLGAVVVVVGYMVLVPVLTFFLLRDWDRLRVRLIDLIPPARRPAVLGFAAEYDRLLGRYLRGQLVLALLVGLVIGLGFRLVNFPYALLLGLVSGMLNIVPYLGAAFAISASVIIALLSGSVGLSLLKVAVVMGVERVLEDSLLAPMIVKESVGLHPVWMILAIALGGFYFGFVGLLVAVPAAVLVKLIVAGGLDRYRASRLYTAAAGEE